MRFLNSLLIIISLFLVGALIFWLWQRQPKGIVENKPEKTSATIETKKNEPDTSVFVVSPKDNDILDSSTVKFSGKTNKDNKIILISNSTSDIANVKPDGTFEITQVLTTGLNLINIISIDRDFKEVQKQTLTLFVQTTDTKDKNVTAGIVNKIFENTLSITTLSGEVSVKTQATTTTTQPTAKTTKATPLPKNKDLEIRVGDYLVVLGTKNKDEDFTASSIEISRENKPQITKKYSPVKLASLAKSRIFSGINLLDNKLLEFKLDKTIIIDSDKKSDEKAIIKDKRAIVFYSPIGSDNIASLIYILP